MHQETFFKYNEYKALVFLSKVKLSKLYELMQSVFVSQPLTGYSFMFTTLIFNYYHYILHYFLNYSTLSYFINAQSQ